MLSSKYLREVHTSMFSQEEDLVDVLELVLALLFEQQQEVMVRLFHQCDGIK